MNTRGIFVVGFITAACVGVLGAPVAAWITGAWVSWGGTTLAAGVPALFFGVLMSQRMARTSSAMPALVGLSWVGVAISAVGLGLGEAGLWALLASVLIGGVGFPAYVFWYSKLPIPQTQPFEVGEKLPDFVLYGVDGAAVSTADLSGAPALLMFFRGNWCPLCMAQIREVASAYQQFADKGVQVALISGQSEEATRSLAERFEVPFLHLIDRDYGVAKQLGLFHEGAVPPGAQLTLGATSGDAWLPIVVVTDGAGVVRYHAQTDNYRVRPDPRDFLGMFEAL